MTEQQQFTRKREKVISLVVREICSGTHKREDVPAIMKDAARRAGVSMTQIEQWAEDPQFEKAVTDRVMDWYEKKSQQMETLIDASIRGMITTITDPNDNPHMRLRSIKSARLAISKLTQLQALDLDGIEKQLRDQLAR